MRLLLALLILPLSAAMTFTEVMFDPAGADAGFEFVEVQGVWNLTGWHVSDAVASDALIPLFINSSLNISLIVDDGFDFTGFGCSIFSTGGNIGNGLNNGGDELTLLDPNKSVIASMSYDGSLGGNGFSIVFTDELWEGSGEPGGTPCHLSAATDTDSLAENFSNSSSQEQTKEREETNPEVEQQADEESCNLSLELVDEKLFYDPGMSIRFRHLVEGVSNFTVRYSIETVDGDKVAERTTQNTAVKQFTPKVSETTEAFIIRNEFVEGCIGESGGEAIVVVRGEKRVAPRNESTLEYLETKKVLYTLGETIMTRMSIYRGSTTKHSVKLWVEDEQGKRVSEITSVSLPERFLSYELSLPVQTIGEGEEGRHLLVLEGLDLNGSVQIQLQGKEKITEVLSPPVSMEDAKPTIVRFYTRSSREQESVYLYAALRNAEGLEAELVGLADFYRLDLNGSQLKAMVNLSAGPNPFVLRLREGEKVLDTSVLLLEMQNGSLLEVNHFTVPREIIEKEKVTENVSHSLKAKNEKLLDFGLGNETEAEGVTATLLFEEERPVRFLPWLLGLVGLVLLAIILFRR